jgi:hypothetical protein
MQSKDLEFYDLPVYCFFRFIKEQTKPYITDTCHCKSTIFCKRIYHGIFYYECYNCREAHVADQIVLKVQLIPHISI